jgi:hypothetical protein
MYFCGYNLYVSNNQSLTMEDKKLPFSTDISFLAETFGIERTGHCEHLNEWVNATGELSDEDQKLLNRIFEKSKDDINYWNEEELKIQLIGLLFFVADIDTKHKIKVFYERSLSTTVDGYELNVISDCLIATPTQFSKPKHPYFFLQEYKKGRGDSKDPECQMLMAMLIAQQINQDNQPLYGSYLFGSRWRFTTLVGNQYCISKEFDADEEADLLQILFILRKLKDLILSR